MAKKAPGLARFAVALAMVLLVTSIPGNSNASVATLNYLEGQITAQASPLEFYDYQSGTVKLQTSQADFDAGTYANTDGSSSPGDVVLASNWWDTNWTQRECFDVDNTAGATALSNYPVQVTPGFAPTTDIRSVDASDVVQPHWVDGATVWTLINVGAGATTSFCLYYNATTPVADLSDQASVFDPGLQNDYVQVAGNAANMVFYSYVDDNIIYDGTTYVQLDAGQTHTFTTGGTGSVFQTLGPVSHRGNANANDMLSPYWWRGTEFIIPTNRSNQDFFIHATDADATD